MQENLCFFDVPYYFLQFLYREKDKDFRKSFRKKLKGGGEIVFQEKLKRKFVSVVRAGLSAKAIAEYTNIDYKDLSRFKNGHMYLCDADAERLEKYLDKVVIPQ